ncbi:hypothetical protein F4859DRAFT_34886 [Xylaria cf. heliscus]|nr:hypothetical protein F4859DRAFT_34886 [Xylaria cf. heliscus]
MKYNVAVIIIFIVIVCFRGFFVAVTRCVVPGDTLHGDGKSGKAPEPPYLPRAGVNMVLLGWLARLAGWLAGGLKPEGEGVVDQARLSRAGK